MDRLSKEKRSWNMSRIRGRDTAPERTIRSHLHRLGYRFRLHVLALPGIPDIVLPRHKTVLLVHGCFWHRHSRCRFAYTPKTRKAFWQSKFAANKSRDVAVNRRLKRLGWRVITIWECQTSDEQSLALRLRRKLGSVR